MTVAHVVPHDTTPTGSEEYRSLSALLASATDRLQRCKARFETASARIELATRLASMGWSELAAREANAALEMVAALGTELSDRHDPSPQQPTASAQKEAVSLTRREKQVLTLLAEGLTNRQIGTRLNVSEHTAHHHVAHILRKLDLPSRAAAAAYAASSPSGVGRPSSEEAAS